MYIVAKLCHCAFLLWHHSFSNGFIDVGSDSSIYINGQNQDVGSHVKAPNKTDSIERYTITHPNFSMSSLLISESVDKLHCENCDPSLIQKCLQLVTPDRNNV